MSLAQRTLLLLVVTLAVSSTAAAAAVKLSVHGRTADVAGVNSKKPPHLCGKYAKPPLFGEIAKNHRFCENLFQCALIPVFTRLNAISD
jgi:hypothetical protein